MSVCKLFALQQTTGFDFDISCSYNITLMINKVSKSTASKPRDTKLGCYLNEALRSKGNCCRVWINLCIFAQNSSDQLRSQHLSYCEHLRVYRSPSTPPGAAKTSSCFIITGVWASFGWFNARSYSKNKNVKFPIVAN